MQYCIVSFPTKKQKQTHILNTRWVALQVSQVACSHHAGRWHIVAQLRGFGELQLDVFTEASKREWAMPFLMAGETVQSLCWNISMLGV